MAVKEIRIIERKSVLSVDFLQLPYLGRNSHGGAVHMLWHVGYWDGPISGICEYQGRRCWFDTAEEVWYEEYEEYDDEEPAGWDRQWSRRFIIFELSADDLAYEETRHERFCEHVGTHTDYRDGIRTIEMRPQNEHHKFYDWAKAEPRRECSKDKPLAWFGFPGPEAE